jgi:hypothetical protein
MEPKRPDLVVIDGDIIAYRASAANEKRFVRCVHKETAEEVEFDTLTKFREWAGDTKDDYEVTPGQKSGPLENAFHILNHMIQNITKACGTESYHIVVSGDDNFRLQLPLPTQYKDSRKESMRPLQLKDCKKYLINSHNAEVSVGVEADDVLVAYATAGNIQASIDKDANHGPFWLYNWDTMTEPEYIGGFGELIEIVKETARKTAAGKPVYTRDIKGKGRIWLYYQMLFGDPVDAYKPCELAKVKFGEIGAYELLHRCKTDKEALEAVAKQYQIWYPEPITYRAWDGSLQENKSWLDIWQMYADCAFMKRFEGDRFDVRKVLKKQGIIDA